MDPPPFSDGGQQPDSYTNSLLPGSGEQSSSVSDFTTEMGPFLTLPQTGSHEQQQALPETGSLRLAPVHPLPPPQSQQHQGFCSPTQHLSPNTPALMTTTQPSRQLRSQEMWHTPPPLGEDLEHLSYIDTPTCASGTSNSNFSPPSPAVTWPSPATSLHQLQPADKFTQDTWAELKIATPLSVDAFPGDASAFSSPGVDIVPGPFDIAGGDWHCEPMGKTTSIPDFTVMAASCPTSPNGLVSLPPAYVAGLKIPSPAGHYEVDSINSRASEPPMLRGQANGATESTPYAQLIYRALMAQPDYSMTLQEIYQWFQQNTDKCKPGQRGWMNSIRHNLSMNAVSLTCFCSIALISTSRTLVSDLLVFMHKPNPTPVRFVRGA